MQSSGCWKDARTHDVLLAEASVSYDQLQEPEDVNPVMDTVDVCIIVGANDVVNPDAKDNEGSPIYGMPIIEADRSKTVFILKRSMASGFAGIDNIYLAKKIQECCLAMLKIYLV